MYGFLTSMLCRCYNVQKKIAHENIAAIIKKQGTSGLPEVHDNIDGTQSCKATHAAEKVSS